MCSNFKSTKEPHFNVAILLVGFTEHIVQPKMKGASVLPEGKFYGLLLDYATLL